MNPVLGDVTKAIFAQRDEVARLRDVADKHPFYKYNGVWTRELQNLVRAFPPPIPLRGSRYVAAAGGVSWAESR